MNLTDLTSYLGLNPGLPPLTIQQFRIDSRLVTQNDVFIAFKGQHCDGHDFAAAAVAQGAIAIVAERPISEVSVPVLVVADSLQALTQAAHAYRAVIHPIVLALTGSNGKTTVKEFLSCMVTPPSFVSQGNFNNHLGVPLNLLNTPDDSRYAVFELGANREGDIAHTAALVRPDIALINNIGPAHLGGFGSMDGVAMAKGEIYQALGRSGIAVINDDDRYAHFWDETLGDRVCLRFSATHTAEVMATQIECHADGCYHFVLSLGGLQEQVMLAVAGRHQVHNALAAASMAYAAGISMEAIVRGLQRFRGVLGRMQVLQGYQQAVIIDDTYNANLASVRVGLEYLSGRQGERILVIGDLAELGTFSIEQHQEIGKIAKQLGIHKVLAVGQATTHTVAAFGSGALHFTSREALIEHLKQNLHQDVSVLVKGSRSAHMEEIVHKIM